MLVIPRGYQAHKTSQLVGGIPTPLKNMKVSWDDEIPNIWENKSHVPVTTKQSKFFHRCLIRFSPGSLEPLAVSKVTSERSCSHTRQRHRNWDRLDQRGKASSELATKKRVESMAIIILLKAYTGP